MVGMTFGASEQKPIHGGFAVLEPVKKDTFVGFAIGAKEACYRWHLFGCPRKVHALKHPCQYNIWMG
eukprot:11166630-Lingulodinium_polyedra.AAC.1